MSTITVPRALLEHVLEALENCTSEHGHRCNRCDSEVDEGGRVVTALRAALAQGPMSPTVQEMQNAAANLNLMKEMFGGSEALAQQEQTVRELLIVAAAMAVVAERKGAYQGASWVADAVLTQEEQEQEQS